MKAKFAILGVFLFASTAVDAAPAQLLNKSVLIAWTDSAQQREADGRMYTEQINRQRVAYISSAGRVFVKAVNGNKSGNGNQREMAPGTDNAALAFQGNTLVGYAINTGFARRLTVSFDAAFSNCTASVVYGNSGGKKTWKSYDGKRTIELLALSASGASCSVRDGNAFAQ